MGEEGKRGKILIKDFNMFVYDNTIHYGKKRFLPLLFLSF